MSLQRYENYRESGERWLGVVPAHWLIHRLKNLFEIRKRIVGEEGHQVLSITQRGIKVKDIESNDGQLSTDYSKYQVVHPGDFAMNHMDLLTGFVDISNYAGVTSPDYRVFGVRDNVLCEPRYFLYLLQNGYRQKIFYAFGQGASEFGRWRFPTDQFNDFRFPCPPPDEQTAIATFLDRETTKIDALISEQEKLIALLAEKRQATISHAVTRGLNPNAPMKDSGLAWLGKVPEHWEMKRLRFVAELNPSKSEIAHYDRATLVSFLPMEAIGDDGSLSLERLRPIAEVETGYTYFRDGDVTLAKITPCFENGKGALMQGLHGGIGFGTTELIVARPMKREVTGELLNWIFRSPNFRQQAESSMYGAGGQKRVPDDFVRDFVWAFPSPDEQVVISKFLDGETQKLDQLDIESRRAIMLLKERRSALIAAAVTGQIDVRGLVEAQPN